MADIYERILAMGVPGSGKSRQWLEIAKIKLHQKSKMKFWCIDTDNAINYMLATSFKGLDVKEGGNVNVFPCYDWKDYMSVVKDKKGAQEIILNSVKPNDMIIIDMADNPWDSVQRYFSSEVFGKTKGSYFLQARKLVQAKMDAAESGKDTKAALSENAFQGWTDWPVINSLYGEFIGPIVNNPYTHLYLTTKVERLSAKEDPTVRAVFGELGLKPTGQKHLGHQVHTIFLYKLDLSTKGSPAWQIKTVKDRSGRTYFDNDDFMSLYYQYLAPEAGWSL